MVDEMKYVFLVSHGELAKGLHSALKMLTGESREDVLSVGLEDGMGADVFAQRVRECLGVIKEGDEILLFADLVGGSPLTTAANTIAEMGLLMKDTMPTAELVDTLIPEARDELKRFEITLDNDEEDI